LVIFFSFIYYYKLKIHYFIFLDAKRLIGRRFDDATVQADMKHWPFEVISEDGKPKIKISYKGENKIFSPEEVFILFNIQLTLIFLYLK
jgi:molecular chaperone DnaK (HSP70)